MNIDSRTKTALPRVLKAQADMNNDGMLARGPSFSDVCLLRQAGLVWSLAGQTVTLNGTPIYHILRRYASRKTNGCYRELTPQLKPVSCVPAADLPRPLQA